MKMNAMIAGALGFAVVMLNPAAAANAAEIKVISSVGVRAALEELKPQFEGATQHKLTLAFGTAVPLKRQIQAGETFDVVILTPALVEDLVKQGKVAPGTQSDVAKAGIGAEMKPKTVLETRSGHTAVAVVEGKAELGFALISEILPVSGAELVGPLPAELQNYVVFTAGISPSARDAQAARAFINFFTAPSALPVLKSKGMEPR